MVVAAVASHQRSDDERPVRWATTIRQTTSRQAMVAAVNNA